MAEINRPLTDAERSLLLRLAVESVARQLGRDRESVADELDAMELCVRGDATDVYLTADAAVLVHAERDWLAFHAAHPGHDPLRDGRPIRPAEDGDQ